MGQMAGDGDLRAGWKVNVRLRSQPRAGLCCRASDYGGSGRAARVIEGRMPPDDPQPGRPEAGHAPAAAAAADCRWMRRAASSSVGECGEGQANDCVPRQKLGADAIDDTPLSTPRRPSALGSIRSCETAASPYNIQQDHLRIRIMHSVRRMFFPYSCNLCPCSHAQMRVEKLFLKTGIDMMHSIFA